MPTYLVCGEVGSGKGMVSVSRIVDYLRRGRPVATNIDLNLSAAFGRFSHAKYIRVPDHPSASDLWAIGYGNDTPDDRNNGALVLDEAGVWLNARDWNGKSRDELVRYLIHVRKMGWDIYLIAQDPEMIDKQARKGVIEHRVQCRRMDRFKVPLFGSVLSLIGLGMFPRIHVGFVRYGLGPNAPVVDRWLVTRGVQAYYNTWQKYDAESDFGVHSVLSPWLTVGRYHRFLLRYLSVRRAFSFFVFAAVSAFLFAVFSSSELPDHVPSSLAASPSFTVDAFCPAVTVTTPRSFFRIGDRYYADGAAVDGHCSVRSDATGHNVVTCLADC